MSATTGVAELIRAQASANPWDRRKAAALTEHAALVEKLNEEYRANKDNDAWHKQVAADLATTLDYGFTFENLFNDYFNVQPVGFNDRIRLEERRGLRVYYTSRGGYIRESQLRTEGWTIPRDSLGFHVSAHTDKLEVGFGQTMADLITHGNMRMEAEVNRRIFNMLQAAVPSSSDFYVGSSGLTKAELNSAVTEVKDAIKPNGMGPIPVTIIGRASMVDKISEIATDASTLFDPEATAEVRARGRLGVYKGATVVQVINYTDDDGLSFIPANELWVFGGTVGKFVTYGSMRVKTWEENTVDYRHYRARKDIGGLVHHPEQARRIVDSSVTP